MWWWIVGIYLAGAVVTAVFNLNIVIGPANPLTILRNALLWPIFLPILLMLSFM